MRGKLLLSFVVAVLITILFSASAQAVIYLSSSSISDSPDPVELGDDVTFRARVISSSNVTAVNVTINGATYNLSWVEMYGIVYYNYSGTVNSSLIEVGTYTYVIEAINTGLEIDNATGTLTITDTTDPVIAAVSAAPDSVEAGSSITISADVTDNDAVGSLTVTATIAGTPYTLTYDGINYTADIGTTGLPEGTNTFDVDASDARGNAATTVSESFEIIDNTAPTIAAVDASPNPVEIADTVTFSAVVIDDIAVDSVLLTVNGINYSMTLGTNYSVAVNSSDIGAGNTTYTVTATDSSFNTATATGTLEVVDQQAPNISSLNADPDPVYNDETVTLRATVTDNLAVEDVTVTVDGTDYTMTNTAGDIYEVAVDASTLTLGTVSYIITATDAAENSASESSFFDVFDAIAPTIDTSTLEIDPDTRVNQNETINFSVDVTDSQGIATVVLTINGTTTSMANTAGDTYAASFDTTGFALGTYTYTITATDIYGNEATVTGTITVTIISPITVAIRADKTSGNAELDVSFTSSVTGGVAPLTYRWNFGNNNIDANKNVRHIFRSDGTFTVTLTVFDQYGNEGTDSVVITVGEKATTNNPRNNIRLDGVSIGNDVVEAGETLDIFVTVENVGEQRLRDISVSAFIPELGVWARTTADDIGRGDSEKQSLALDIPEDAEPGIYDVRIVISNDGMKRVKHRDIEII